MQALFCLLIIGLVVLVCYIAVKYIRNMYNNYKRVSSSYVFTYGGDITAKHLKTLRACLSKNGKLISIDGDFFSRSTSVTRNVIDTYTKLSYKFKDRGDLEELDSKLFDFLLRFNFTMNVEKSLLQLSEFNESEYFYIELVEYYLFLLYHVGQYLFELREQFIINISSAKILGRVDYEKLSDLISKYEESSMSAVNFALYYIRFKHLFRIIGSDGFYRSFSDIIFHINELVSTHLIPFKSYNDTLIQVFSNLNEPRLSVLLDLKKKSQLIQDRSLYYKCKYFKALCIFSDKNKRVKAKDAFRADNFEPADIASNLDISEIRTSFLEHCLTIEDKKSNSLYRYFDAHILESITEIDKERKFLESSFYKFLI